MRRRNSADSTERSSVESDGSHRNEGVQQSGQKNIGKKQKYFLQEKEDTGSSSGDQAAGNGRMLRSKGMKPTEKKK